MSFFSFARNGLHEKRTPKRLLIIHYFWVSFFFHWFFIHSVCPCISPVFVVWALANTIHVACNLKPIETNFHSYHSGYTHSALNPILHWALNQNSLRQSSLLSRLTSVQRYLQAHFNDRNHQPPPSSTNEAALGPFNPRFIKARPQPYNNPPASSHFMY